MNSSRCMNAQCERQLLWISKVFVGQEYGFLNSAVTYQAGWDQLWQQVVCAPSKATIEKPCIGWRLWTDVKSPCPLHPRLAHKACRRLDYAGTAHAQKNIGPPQRLEDFVQFIWSLAKPADVRPDHAAAFAARDFRATLVEPLIGKWQSSAALASALEQLAMHVNRA